MTYLRAVCYGFFIDRSLLILRTSRGTYDLDCGFVILGTGVYRRRSPVERHGTVMIMGRNKETPSLFKYCKPLTAPAVFSLLIDKPRADMYRSEFGRGLFHACHSDRQAFRSESVSDSSTPRKTRL